MFDSKTSDISRGVRNIEQWRRVGRMGRDNVHPQLNFFSAYKKQNRASAVDLVKRIAPFLTWLFQDKC